MKFVAVVLCGGKGERFWPLSRNENPKQFLQIAGEGTLIEQTARRLKRVPECGEILLVSNAKFRQKLDSMFPGVFKILEPVGKNTAPACAVANEYVRRRYGEVIVGVFPSDHFIKEDDVFLKAIDEAVKLAQQGYIVTIGIKPARPETGYGYIERGEKLGEKSYKAIKFHEKPERETAEKYVSSGKFYWNAGMFVWKTDVFDEAVRKFMPDFYKVLKESKIPEELDKVYEKAPEISVDYAIMEKADNIAVVEGEFFWEDLGAFPSLFKVLDTDEEGNIISGEAVVSECKNSIFIQRGPLIAAYGLSDVIVVSTNDVVLVIPMSEAQNIKKLRAILKERGLEKLL
ncbi:MAG: mannose-1-phosphate guanylyltransferase [bacterium]|nr:mannose-1-phosphate guanylyltransferase [bacterium]